MALFDKYPYFKMPLAVRPYFDALSDAEVGRVMTDILIYCKDGSMTKLKGKALETFMFLKKWADYQETHPRWRGSVVADSTLARRTKAYKQWREAVYARDDYTCQMCGRRGGKLNAHHIKPFARYPELRTAVENGITLCERCHKEEHRRK